MSELWADWFREGQPVEAFQGDINEVIEYLRQWEAAVIAHVNKKRQTEITKTQ
jgi:hypothetical protein